MVARANLCFMGEIGTGKTTSLRNLHKYRNIALVSTDNGAASILGDIPCEGDGKELHWMHVPPAGTDWATMIKVAKIVNTLSNAKLQEHSSIEPTKYQQWIGFLEAHADFTCDRCQKHIGMLDNLDETWAVVDDNLTGISKMAIDVVVGAKPVRTLPDWGVGQEMILNYVFKCTGDLKASYILMSHISREKDEISGAMYVTAATLGVKLAPKLLPMFDEVVLTERDKMDFWWATTGSGITLKSRILPISEDITPDFGKIFGEGAPR